MGRGSGDGLGGDSGGGGTAMLGRAAKSSDNCVAAEAGNAGAAPAARRAAMSFVIRGIAGRTRAESRSARGAIAAGRRPCSTQCRPTEVWFRWFKGKLSRRDQRTRGVEESSSEFRLI